jgi:uncharacterized membrane protein YozB (DUF420 family)
LSVSDLPALNATLNATCGLFLIAGYVAVRSGRIPIHRACMISAFAASMLFLVSYLYYHSQVGSVRFQGQGWVRTVYFTILISHSILAAAIVPLALVTLYRALRSDFNRHKRIARWALPIWLYVSATGIVVYLMLYQLDGL